MVLKSLALQNFRSYKKASFEFVDGINIIAGPNASGKSNLIESLYLLSVGKSRRADHDTQLIHFGDTFCRIKGIAEDELEVAIALSPDQKLRKKYLVNAVSKRRVDFAGRLPVVLFTPLDLEIAIGQPSHKRRFLDEVLEQVDYEYRVALTTYTKALRQRNALLEQVQREGVRNQKLFQYWDDLLISNGQLITSRREELIVFINNRPKDLFAFTLVYDKSTISHERLAQYKDAEVGAGVTLVGPHRDDVTILSYQQLSESLEDVKYFSSRGQQRLVVLELKLSQILYFQNKKNLKPLLLLDDILSELDESHINHVFSMTGAQQTIITTTHRDFVPKNILPRASLIDLTQITK